MEVTMNRSERERLGLYFKTLATQRELKQRDIARKIGHERSMISKIFGGSIQADEPYERVAEFFGTTLEQSLASAAALVAALGVMAGDSNPEDEQEPKRGYVLGVASQKGGVGKTTLSVNLACALANKDLSVLLLDTDPQGNATSYFGLFSDGQVFSDVLRGIKSAQELEITETDFGVDLVMGGDEVRHAREQISSLEGVRRFQSIIDPLRDIYDVIIIDTAPTMGAFQQATLAVIDGVISPMFLEAWSVDGLEAVLAAIEIVKPQNPDLEFLGSVITKCDTRKKAQQSILAHLEEHELANLLEHYVRTDAKIEESQILSIPVRAHEQKSKSAQDYDKLAEWFVKEVL
jgi:chromosome partitioning protein